MLATRIPSLSEEKCTRPSDRFSRRWVTHYISEIFRGSVKTIDLVQFDAAKSLGLSAWGTFRKVVLPQVLVYGLPSLGGQVILLLKDTSLLSAISVAELTMNAKLLTEQTGAAYEAFVVVAVLYLLLVVCLELTARFALRAVRWRPRHDAL
jgi:ABC-type amino acid transport system permease subunit